MTTAVVAVVVLVPVLVEDCVVVSEVFVCEKEVDDDVGVEELDLSPSLSPFKPTPTPTPIPTPRITTMMITSTVQNTPTRIPKILRFGPGLVVGPGQLFGGTTSGGWVPCAKVLSPTPPE